MLKPSPVVWIFSCSGSSQGVVPLGVQYRPFPPGSTPPVGRQYPCGGPTTRFRDPTDPTVASRDRVAVVHMPAALHPETAMMIVPAEMLTLPVSLTASPNAWPSTTGPT